MVPRKFRKRPQFVVLVLLVLCGFARIIVYEYNTWIKWSGDTPRGSYSQTGFRNALFWQSESYERRKLAVCGTGWQEKYRKLHQDILLKRRPSRFLVYSCAGRNYGCAGYGNRLNSIASLLLLAILTDRAFIIDWRPRTGVTMDTFWEPKNINWNVSVFDMRDLEFRKHYWGKGRPKYVGSDVIRPALDMDGIVKWSLEADIPRYFNRSVEIITSTWYLADMFLKNPSVSIKASQLGLSLSDEMKFSFLGCAFDFLFKTTPILEEKLKAAKASLGLPPTVPFVGLHVRIGDEAFGFKGRKTSNVKRFFECAKQGERFLETSRRDGSHEVKWFLATDDAGVKSYASQNYADKVVTLNITLQHIDKLGSRSLTSRGMLGVLLDHFLLSESSISVLSRSTFGLTARALGFHSPVTYSYGEDCTF